MVGRLDHDGATPYNRVRNTTMPTSVLYRALQAGAFLLVTVIGASADPFAIAPSDFSGNETIVNFGGLSPGTPIAGNFLGQGVFFGFGLFAASEADTATNSWDFFLTNPITVDFLATVSRVGFDISAGDGDLVVLTAFDTNGALTGSIPFIVGSSFSFVGMESGLGISQFWIQDQSFPGAFSIQNLRFDLRPESAVPEPWSVLLTATVAAFVVWRLRCSQRGRRQLS